LLGLSTQNPTPAICLLSDGLAKADIMGVQYALKSSKGDVETLNANFKAYFID
jgi:hypothetical protein